MKYLGVIEHKGGGFMSHSVHKVSDFRVSGATSKCLGLQGRKGRGTHLIVGLRHLEDISYFSV